MIVIDPVLKLGVVPLNPGWRMKLCGMTCSGHLRLLLGTYLVKVTPAQTKVSSLNSCIWSNICSAKHKALKSNEQI